MDRHSPLGTAYWNEGYVFPLKAFEAGTALGYRQTLEQFESESGGPLQAAMRHQIHLIFPWAQELIRNDAILDAIEQVIGPDILCWSTNFFIKEPRDGNFVSWHQDATYWGLEPHDSIVTAWLALSDATIANGAMKFLPGSHTDGQMAHQDTYHESNLLTRGQEIEVNVDDKDAIDVTLKAGEFSLHHVLLAHGSRPNETDDRRIGLAIRYIPTSAKQTKLRDTAILVRGSDAYGHFDLLPAPKSVMDEEAVAIHKDATARMAAAVYSDAERDDFRA